MMLQEQEKQHSGKVERIVLQSKPQLEVGVNLVEKPDKLPVFQSLISEETEGGNTSAVWIDTKNEASTYALNNFGGQKLLENVYIGRAFTAFQHHRLVQQLDDFIRENTRLLVLPNISHLYISGQVNDWEAEELFQETWEKVLEIQKKHDLKVLVSVPETDSGLNYAVIGDSDNKVQVENTEQGWKYNSNNFNQYGYREDDLVQTTMPYWQKKTCKAVKVTAEAV